MLRLNLMRLDALEYLRDVLPRLARGIREVEAEEPLAHRWKAQRGAKAQPRIANPSSSGSLKRNRLPGGVRSTERVRGR
jgi:hypothetical protein